MNSLLLALVAAFGWSCALGADAPPTPSPVAAQSSFVWAKLTTSLSTTSSKRGDPVTALVMGPGEALLGATLEGTVDRAERATLSFTFHQLRLYNGKTYAVQSRLISVVNSKGVAGQDDLGQRVGENAGIVAYGITTALNEGSEVFLSVWAK